MIICFSDDFLDFFESSTQPKIKGAGAGGKKPSSNAVKVMWDGTPANQV